MSSITPAPLPAAELVALRNLLMSKPFLTEDLIKVEQAIERRHNALLHVVDPSEPWSGKNRAPTRALVVVGPSRSGKTRAMNSALARLKALQTSEGETVIPRPLQVNAPEHFTIEALGRAMLNRLKLMPARSLGPSRTVERLHTRIQIKQPTIAHIDEAQRMLTPDRVAQHRRDEEQVKNFGQLRALVDLDGWPLPLVLSGTTELTSILERSDLSFFREIADVIVMTPMMVGRQSDRDDLDDALAGAAEKVGMQVDLSGCDDFFDRLILAANKARGLAFDICHEAILLAAEVRRKTVSVEDFETFYARKAGCLRAANPFAATDWHRIDPKALLAAMSGDKAPKIWEINR